MATLDCDNFVIGANPLLGYARNDINTFIRNCYATNDPTNTVNQIMTIEEDDEEDDEEVPVEVNFSVIREERYKRIEDWNKVYNSDDDVVVDVPFSQGAEGTGEGEGGVLGQSRTDSVGEGGVLGQSRTALVEKNKESFRRASHKCLKVSFADDFGYALIEKFLILNATEDEDPKVTVNANKAEGMQSSAQRDEDESDKENNSHLSNVGAITTEESLSEEDGFAYLEMTINKLISNDINLSDEAQYTDLFGQEVDLCGGEVDLCGGEVDLCGGEVDLCGGEVDLCRGEVDLGRSEVDLCGVYVGGHNCYDIDDKNKSEVKIGGRDSEEVDEEGGKGGVEFGGINVEDEEGEKEKPPFINTEN